MLLGIRLLLGHQNLSLVGTCSPTLGQFTENNSHTKSGLKAVFIHTFEKWSYYVMPLGIHLSVNF